MSLNCYLVIKDKLRVGQATATAAPNDATTAAPNEATTEAPNEPPTEAPYKTTTTAPNQATTIAPNDATTDTGRALNKCNYSLGCIIRVFTKR